MRRMLAVLVAFLPLVIPARVFAKADISKINSFHRNRRWDWRRDRQTIGATVAATQRRSVTSGWKSLTLAPRTVV
jgi:hypothetical protein